MLRLEKQRLKHEDLRSHTIRITQIISPRESSQQLRKQKGLEAGTAILNAPGKLLYSLALLSSSEVSKKFFSH